jgi:hypothetical protein
MRQEVPTSIEEILNPRRSALLLWDMHDGVATRRTDRLERPHGPARPFRTPFSEGRRTPSGVRGAPG